MKKYIVLLFFTLFYLNSNASVLDVPVSTPDGINVTTNTVGNDDVVIVDFGEDITPYLDASLDAYISIGSKMIYSGLGKFWDSRADDGEGNFLYSIESSIITINSSNHNQLLINLSTISITDGSSISITLSEGCVFSEVNPSDFNQVQVLSYKGEVPTLYLKAPFHTQDNVLPNDTVVLTYSARVYTNTGAAKVMSIINTTDATTLWTVTSNASAGTKVVVTGNKVTLRVNTTTPITFAANKNYKLVMDAGFFKTKSPLTGSDVAAITDGSWTFSTKEITASSFSPTDGSTGVSISADYSVTFNTNIVAGTGNVRIYKTTNPSTPVDVIPVSACSISGATLTIPHASLEGNTAHYIRIDKKIVKSSTTNAYFRGIYDNTTWNFTTQSSNTWDGGAFNNDFLDPINYVGDTYDNTMPVIISTGDIAILSSDETIPELVINSTGKMEIASGATLTVTGKVSLLSTSESNSSLVINGNLSVSPSNVFIYQYASATSPASLKKGYATPVTSITGSAAKFVNPIVKFNNSTALYENVVLSSTLSPTVGYASYATSTLTFTGVINNDAEYNLTLNYTSNPGGSAIYSSAYNFYGNPYTAPIDWQKMWSELTPTDTTKVRQTCWVLKESGTWISINGLSGIASDGGEGVIPRGHAFMLRAKPGDGGGDATNTIKLKRSDLVSTSRSMLKSSVISQKPEIIRLSGLSNGYSSNIVIGLHSDASTSYDLYDSEYQTFPITSASYDGRLQIATYINDNPYAINTLPYSSEILCAVAYYVKTAGTYSISLSSIDESLLSKGAKVYLIDMKVNRTVELLQNELYTFYSGITPVVDKNRFVAKIVFSSGLPTNNQPIEAVGQSSIKISYFEGSIYLNSSTSNQLQLIEVYNINGTKLLSRDVSGNSSVVPFEGSGVYVVKVISDKGVSSHKIVASAIR